MPKIEIEDLINCHKNNDCLILGSSPQMMNFDFDNFNGKIISVGDSYLRIPKKINIDYWVVSNNEFPIPEIEEHLEIINNINDTKLLFSDTGAYNLLFKKDDLTWKDKIKIKYHHYDERHFKKKECNPRYNCCDILYKDNKYTIQETLLNHFNESYDFKKSGTCAEHGLTFALLMGFKRIFIQGIDIPKNPREYIDFPSDYADKVIERKNFIISKLYRDYYKKRKNLISVYIKRFIEILRYGGKYKNDFKINYINILENFKILFRIAKKNKIEIHICNTKSSLNNIKF